MTDTLAPSTSSSGLAAASMGGFEVLAQSVAGIAPSAVMATGPALVALGAGGSIIYSYLASTVILLLVGWCINQFARRMGEGGTLLSYVRRAFGPGTGFVSSIGLAFGYTLIAVGCLAGIALYATPLLHVHGTLATLAIEAVAAALAGYAMVRGVQLSTRVGMALEIISIGAILTVIVAVFAHKGFSSAPLHPSGFGVGSVTGGMVLAILGYVGFESAACLGTEAKSATRTIPRAVLGSVAVVTVLYVLSGYAQLTGFGSAEGITKSAAPLNDLADAAGVHPLGYLVDLGAVASFFACVTGSLNAASRLLHAMGQDRLLHRSMSTTHPSHRTPHQAIIGLTAVTGLIALVMSGSGLTTTDVFAYAGTIGTYGYMVTYILVAVGVSVFLHRTGSPIAVPVLIGGLAAAGMVYVLYKSVYPVPAYPYNLLPWLFLAVLAVAAGWYAVARRGLQDVVPETA